MILSSLAILLKYYLIYILLKFINLIETNCTIWKFNEKDDIFDSAFLKSLSHIFIFSDTFFKTVSIAAFVF